MKTTNVFIENKFTFEALSTLSHKEKLSYSTEFITVGQVESKTFKKLPYCKVEKVVKGALKSAKRGKFIYTPTFLYKFYRVLAKILPHAWLVPISKT